MDDTLIADEDLSVDRKSRLPGTGFFYPDSLENERTEERVRKALDGASAAVVTDSDADGLGCAAVIRAAADALVDPTPFEQRLARRLRGEDSSDGAADSEMELQIDTPGIDSSVALIPTGPRTLVDSLERVATYLDPGTDVFICDLSPDTFETISEPLGTIVETAGETRWFDHHQWDEAAAKAVRTAGVDLDLDRTGEQCSTDVALGSLDGVPERFREVAAVTRDHDLWLKEDERSEDLADYAAWSDPEEYVAIVGTYGVDFPTVVQEYLSHRRTEKQRLITRAVDRATFREIGPWTVGVTYGRCSQNEVAESLRDQGADAAVIVKPAGSASIRGSDQFERAHEVAAHVNGGGHPQAAGCKPDIYDDMLDYAHHWTTEGAAAKRVILAAFRRVVNTESGPTQQESTEDPPEATD